MTGADESPREHDRAAPGESPSPEDHPGGGKSARRRSSTMPVTERDTRDTDFQGTEEGYDEEGA